MALLKEYDPGLVDLIAVGIPISGFAEGTFIVVEREADAYTKSVGSDGEVSRTRNRNLSGTITFTTMATSPVNLLLSGVALADENFGTGVFPSSVSDNSGLSLHIAAESWIRKVPNAEFADERGNREWIIDCADLSMLSGGN